MVVCRQYLEPAVQPSVRTLDQSLINTVNSVSALSLAQAQQAQADTLRKQSNCSDTDTSINNNSRAKGRKRWGLNMGGGKSGSVKSNKSEKSDKSGDESRQSSGRGRGVGAMGAMLANLHGLARSRPDILAGADTEPAAFTAPNKIPRESLGQYLETKLAEGEVLKEF